MSSSLSEHALSRLSDFIAAEMGLYFPRERWPDLERGIAAAARSAGAGEMMDYVEWLLSAPLTRSQVETLAGELTVGETYFMREPRGFEILAETILPELIRQRQGREQRLRIWSAGCCTGEEAYSIAIVLDTLLPIPGNWNVTILATDINPRFLRKASAGLFGQWSFRNCPAWFKDYFEPAPGNHFRVPPRIRERVRFEYLNLAEDVYPSLAGNTNAMDVIFCRNVLMYFAPERVRKVIRNFHRAIVDGGWLIVSATETSAELSATFSPVHFEGAILYGKKQRPETVSRPLAQPPVFAEALSFIEAEPEPEAQPPLEPQLVAEEPVEETVEQMTLSAKACANSGELSMALEWAERSITADKLNAGLRYLRATILQELGATEDAVSTLKAAVYLDPGFALAHFALGNLALRQRRRAEGKRHFANALDILAHYQPEEVLPQSEGLVAGRLRQIIESTVYVEEG